MNLESLRVRLIAGSTMQLSLCPSHVQLSSIITAIHVKVPCELRFLKDLVVE